MPEFRTHVVRHHGSAARRALRIGLLLAATGLAGLLLADAWSLLETETPSLLQALRWRVAPWT